MGNAKENFIKSDKYEENELCYPDCQYISQEIPIAKRWLKGESKYTILCNKYGRLIECIDLGFGGNGPKFLKCKKCRKDSLGEKDAVSKTV